MWEANEATEQHAKALLEGRGSMMERVNSGVGERNSHNIYLHTILGTPPVPSPLTPKSLVWFPVPRLPPLFTAQSSLDSVTNPHITTYLIKIGGA